LQNLLEVLLFGSHQISFIEPLYLVHRGMARRPRNYISFVFNDLVQVIDSEGDIVRDRCRVPGRPGIPMDHLNPAIACVRPWDDPCRQ